MSWESEPVKARSLTAAPGGAGGGPREVARVGGPAGGSGGGPTAERGPPKSRKKITLLKGSRRRHWALPAPLRAVTSKKSRSPAAPANWKRSVSLAGSRVPGAGG